MWSSPANRTTPLSLPVPAMLARLNSSRAHFTPWALPYQNPSTPPSNWLP